MEFDFVATHIRGASNKICDSLSRLPIPPPGELKSPSPVGVGHPVSSATLSRDMSLKYLEIDFPPEEVVNLASCLALLPDPEPCTISICAVLGSPSTAVWDILPLSVHDVAKATREDKVYGNY